MICAGRAGHLLCVRTTARFYCFVCRHTQTLFSPSGYHYYSLLQIVAAFVAYIIFFALSLRIRPLPPPAPPAGRDVKSANVFIHDDGTVRLGDMGCARVLDQNAGRIDGRTCSTPCGTPMSVPRAGACTPLRGVRQLHGRAGMPACSCNPNCVRTELACMPRGGRADWHSCCHRLPPLKIILVCLQRACRRFDWSVSRSIGRPFRFIHS